MTSLAELTGHSQSEGTVESASKETSKGTNGETGVAGNSHSSKKDQGLKGEGGTLRVLDGERGRVVLEKDREKERQKEKDRELSHAQATKASRRTTSLLNLFMSNSQGRSLTLKLCRSFGNLIISLIAIVLSYLGLMQCNATCQYIIAEIYFFSFFFPNFCNTCDVIIDILITQFPYIRHKVYKFNFFVVD